MAIDTPARIAVLGAGPVGLEAALYARFLGYDVEIYERGRVAENVLRQGHLSLLAPFGQNRSTLGLAALEAHDESFRPPADDDCLTAREWADHYLLPLSQTDLLADHLHLGVQVVAVGKDEILKGDLPGHEDRGDYDFRLLVRDAAGQEQMRRADAVLDATGTLGNANWLGQGGLPALGELRWQEHLVYDVPDVLGESRRRYAGRHTLVVGSGHSAATTIVAFAQLSAESPGTRVTWVTRREPVAATGPVGLVPEDPLPHRDRLARAANELALAVDGPIAWRPGTFVDELRREPSGALVVVLSGLAAGELPCDEIIANVGHRPDHRLHAELPLALDPRTDAPTTMTSEPNYYILGAKSRGRQSGFLFSGALAQIRTLFAIIGDRVDLDLYTGAQKLVRQAR